MSLRQWFIRVLGGSAEVERHGDVELAVIEGWRAGLVSAALKDQGIGCRVVSIQQYPMSEYVRPMARVLIDHSDAAQAQEILNEIDSHTVGDDG